MWSEIVDPGVYAMAGLAAVGVVGLFLYRESIPPFLSGAIVGALLLVHQMFIFCLPAVIVCHWISGGSRSRLWPWIAGFVIVGILPITFFMFRYNHSAHDMLIWLFSPPGQRPGDSLLHHQFWHWNLVGDIPLWWHSTVESFIGPSLQTHVAAFHTWEWVWQAFLVLGCASVCLDVVSGRKLALTRPVIIGLALWIISLNVFQLFFAVGVVRYKVLFLPTLITLILTGSFSRHFFLRLAPVCIGMMALVNFQRSIPLTQSAANPDLIRIAWINGVVHPTDFLLISGDGPTSVTNVALRYFSPTLHARSLRGILFEQYGRADFKELDRQMSETWSHGGQVFVESGLVYDTALQSRLSGADNPFGVWLMRSVLPARTWGGPDSYSLTLVVPKNL